VGSQTNAEFVYELSCFPFTVFGERRPCLHFSDINMNMFNKEKKINMVSSLEL